MRLLLSLLVLLEVLEVFILKIVLIKVVQRLLAQKDIVILIESPALESATLAQIIAD